MGGAAAQGTGVKAKSCVLMVSYRIPYAASDCASTRLSVILQLL